MAEQPGADWTKAQLLELARHRNIRGRSRMTKAQLLEALQDPPPPEAGAAGRHDSEFRSDPAYRRDQLAARLAAFVDRSRSCSWRSIEGLTCGLPVAVGKRRCMLHGGGDITDVSVPVTGRLGVDTWPALLRQLWMASYDIDPFGLDPVVAEMVWHVLNGLYFEYFRVEVEGIGNVPTTGPAIVAANHGGGALPYDAMMLQLAVANESEVPRRVRVIGTEIFNMLPVVSHLYRKVGAAYASRDDARRLLASGHLLGVFPEGEKGFMKPARRAYELQRFGRGGFVELAARASAPIVPVAIVGSEEVHPTVIVSERLADLVKLVFPQQRVSQIGLFLNPLPLPVRWKIRFLEPVRIDARQSQPDPLEVLETAELVRGQIQKNLDEMIAGRDRLY